MKQTNSQSGFTPIYLILMLVIFGIIGFAGWKVYSSNVKPNTHTLSSDNPIAKPAPTNFSECIRAGGHATDVRIPPNPHHRPSSTDTAAATLLCSYRDNGYRAEFTDISCENQGECAAILQAARKICSKEYGVNANTQDPTFMYEPVIKDSYARLQLTDCSAEHYKLSVAETIFLNKTGADWQILKVANANTTCKDVDGIGIPLELLYVCVDPGVGFRVPK